MPELDVLSQFDHCFWMGDLNYRSEVPSEDGAEMSKEQRWEWHQDQTDRYEKEEEARKAREAEEARQAREAREAEEARVKAAESTTPSPSPSPSPSHSHSP